MCPNFSHNFNQYSKKYAFPKALSADLGRDFN